MNELTHDLKEKLEDPRFWTDEYLQEQVREILARYDKEGTPPGSEEAAAAAREIMAKCDRRDKDQAGRPIDMGYEVARVISLLPDVKYEQNEDHAPISDHAPTREHAPNTGI